MSDIIDYTDVPYLQEILNFLPINPEDEEDVINYIQNITNLIAVNHKYGQYQFAYFGIHLLYMTYIYCTAWKISQIEGGRYQDAILFARPYSGREEDFKINDARTIFDYSLMPEADVAKLFRIIDLDKSQISNVASLVGARNKMAHASGKFEILTDEGFEVQTHTVLTSVKNIHRKMDCLIRKWYASLLLNYCEGSFASYNNPKDIIEEQMIQSFKLSVNELLVCNEMSIRKLKETHKNQLGYPYRLQKFKKTMTDYCQEMGYI